MVQPVEQNAPPLRDTIFISKATPGDDAFALWLAPRLEAQGYKVFADIMSLEGGDRWRKKITDALQFSAARMLLCCSDETLARRGVEEEISIAEDLVRELKDPNFLIPLRIRPFRKIFGTGGLQYIDFSKGWAEGLSELLKTLDGKNVPRGNPSGQISEEWERYQKRSQITLEQVPEPLTLNWVRMASAPDRINYISPTGAISHASFAREIDACPYPLVKYNRGFFGFCDPADLAEHFSETGKVELVQSFALDKFLEEGAPDLSIEEREAKNFFTQIARVAWENYCASLGLTKYEYSSGPAFHVGDGQAKIGQRIPWGRQGSKRSSMLRNISKRKVWEFGMSAIPALYPFPHFRLKSRVLFSEIRNENERGDTIADVAAQHRHRRTVCSPWRNPAWHGRLMAYLELLAGDSATIKLVLGKNERLTIDAAPLMVTSPVSTKQVNLLGGDAEETDDSTLPPGYDEEAA